MSLTMFFITILGGLVLFAAAFLAATFGLFHFGFKLTPALAPLIILAACLGLMLLWPISYILRWIWCKIRKQEMGPVHPEIIVPRWLSLSVKVIIGSVVTATLSIICLAAFLHLGLLGYQPLVSGQNTKLGTISFKSAGDEGAAVYDIKVTNHTGKEWVIDDESGELWLVKAHVFTMTEYPTKVFSNLGLQNCARVTTLCKSQAENAPFLSCRELDEASFFENLLGTLSPYFKFLGLHFRKVEGKGVKPLGDGKLQDIVQEPGNIKFVDSSTAGATSSPSSGGAGEPGGAGAGGEDSASAGSTTTGAASGESGASTTDEDGFDF